MDEIFALLVSRCDDDGFTQANHDEVYQWAEDCGLGLSDFLDKIGVELARKYQSGELSFEFCDSLVNVLWGALIFRAASGDELGWPDRFSRVYEAFDAGEFHRSADQSDNPIADFTNPQIAAFLAESD